MSRTAILIPTLRRPDSLARALRSVFTQERAGELIREIVVVDNSPEASARATVEALRPESPAPLVYVHEPHPGVATARNAGLAATDAPLIAFIDDDEEAAPGWLAALLASHEALAADVTFGPVQGVAATAKPSARPYLEQFFSRTGPTASGVIEDAFGCGNSVMTRATALAGPEPFETAADQTGGEDDRLFTRLRAQGGRFGWAAEAVVYEHAPPHRARLSYALTRAMGYGQSPSQICARAGDWIGVAKWMLVGAVQTLMFGGVAAGLWIARRPARYAYADRAARGLGKIFWTNFLKFYGATEARRTARLAARRGSRPATAGTPKAAATSGRPAAAAGRD